MKRLIAMYVQVAEMLCPLQTPFLLAANTFVACQTAGRKALGSLFCEPRNLYAADPFTFLFVSLKVLAFGVGFLSLNHIGTKQVKEHT